MCCLCCKTVIPEAQRRVVLGGVLEHAPEKKFQLKSLAEFRANFQGLFFCILSVRRQYKTGRRGESALSLVSTANFIFSAQNELF